MLQKRILIAEITDNIREYSLAGWVKDIREDGFILWDMSGEAMISCKPENLKFRDVVAVVINSDGNNRRNSTVLSASKIEILNTSEPDAAVPQIKKEYTYLKFFDHGNILLAKKINQIENQIRHFLGKHQFIETRNPLLWTSVQEYGFNEFKVYNEISNQFEYTLLQSPNILNLLNNIGGMERIFQFHPCFRLSEESPHVKTDALVEFTQLAINCDFFTNEDGKELIEQMLKHICRECFEAEITVPFPVFDYKESIRLYGSDKPDFRYREFLQPLYTEYREDDSSTYKTLFIPYSLSDPIIRLISNQASNVTVSGYALLQLHEGQLLHIRGRELDLVQFRAFLESLPSLHSGVILLIEGETNLISAFFSSIIRSITQKARIEKYAFCWIENYPFLEEGTGERSPLEGIGQNIFTKRQEMGSKGIDLILNGVEIASGSEKEYRAKDFMQSLQLLHLNIENYTYYLDALRSGSPPVFTIGIGWERLLWKLMNTEELQDVMIFPKDQTGKSLLIQSSGVVINANV